MSRVLLKGGQVVTVDARDTLHPAADILVEQGRIAAIAPTIAAPADAEVIDLSGHIVLPGFIDTHRHSWQTGIRGVAADWSLLDYVRGIRMGYARAYRPEDVYISILVGLLEALDSGITTLCDFCHIMNSPAHADAALAAVREAGLRTRLHYGFYDVPLPQPAFADHAARLADAERIVRTFGAIPGLSELGVALTEAKLVSPAETAAEIGFARRHGLPITAHMGTLSTPDAVARLGADGLLGPDILHVHCNFSSDEELKMIRDSGGAVSCTPETELQMAMGFPVIGRLMALGMAPSLGIDIVSDYSGDMFSQMRIGLQVERALRNEPSLRAGKMPASISPGVREGLRFATVNGAAAMNRGVEIGSLEVAKQADIVALRQDGLHFLPPAPAVPAIVLQARASDVAFVMVGGAVRKRDSRLLGHDMARLRAAMLATQTHLASAPLPGPAETATSTGRAYASAIEDIVAS
ncbi:MAG: amidohydrolase family protein [Reyranella sp.]|uniref:amidohydrolase family protein n=1 Tax=Reyranella sp. TaxID=1929291 RepID=UPI0025EDB132|nr:amidohydrolase family protein [Reyranella sp.]MBR2819299.1 amidohydrolase family protein [Reyranella sp.]